MSSNLPTTGGIPRLSGEYNRGYMNAIIDVTDELESINYDLTLHRKRMTMPYVRRAMKLFMEYRENYREHGNGFIRYNTKLNDLEFHIPERKKQNDR